MNASLPPLPRLIEFILDALNASPADWPRFARTVDELPRVTLNEAGEATALLAISAKGLLRQLPRVSPESAPFLLETLRNLTAALRMELNLHGKTPYYIERS